MNHIVRLALDRSVRSYDRDGRLRIATAVLTRCCVSPYMGAEIVDYQLLGLTPSRVYQVLRPASELQRALDGFNELPILTRHVPVSADDHRGELVVGSTGSNAALVNLEVTNSLMIWASPGIQLIESGVARSLSCGYAYTPVVRSGSFEGVPYNLVMTDIQPNHLALVAEPRVAGAMVGDAMPQSFLKRNSKMSKDAGSGEADELDVVQVFANLLEYLEGLLQLDQLEIVKQLLDGHDIPDEESGARDDVARRGISGGAKSLAEDHARSVRAQRAAMGRDSVHAQRAAMGQDSAERRRLAMFPNANRLATR